MIRKETIMSASAPAAPLARLPERLHHHAYVVADQEINRRFFEDILGLPLVATWCEASRHPLTDAPTPLCHTFFALEDGGALAFFQFADPEVYRLCTTDSPPRVRNFDHIAFKVDDPTYAAIVARLRGADQPVRETDHGYCRSAYATSPDGLIVEFTVDPPDAAAIAARRRADAHATLARWLAGDHRPNNELRAAHAA